GQRLGLGPVLINRDWQAAVGHCPLCPQKRTFVSALSMSSLCHKQTSELATKSHMIEADPANLVADLRVEGRLVEGHVRAGSRPPVGGHFYRSLGGILHNRFTERSTALALNVSQLFALIQVRLRRYDAVRGVGAEHIKITVLEAALAIVEHIKRLRLVLFHCGHCSLEHSFGFLGSSEVSRPE